jgi:predicted SAM-dependent methyltransferase
VIDGGLYVQYGCGLCAPDGWLNFDASPRLRLEQTPGLRAIIRLTAGLLFPANVRPGDIVRGLPVADGSARGVYCSHVLEHLTRDDLPRALGNTWRMIVPGGIFRLIVPDLRWRVERYLRAAEKDDPAAADMLMTSCALGAASKATMISALRARFGWNAHLWMYDFAALKALLEQAGFSDIRRCERGDSRDPKFALVEDQDRFFESGERELAIEAAKPRGAGAPTLDADRLEA